MNRRAGSASTKQKLVVKQLFPLIDHRMQLMSTSSQPKKLLMTHHQQLYIKERNVFANAHLRLGKVKVDKTVNSYSFLQHQPTKIFKI